MLKPQLVNVKEMVLVVSIPMAESTKKMLSRLEGDDLCVYINRKKERARIVEKEWLNNSEERAFALFPRNNSIDIAYLAYIMNARAIDYYVQNYKAKRSLTAEKLSNLPMAIVSMEDQKNIAIVDQMIQQLENMSEDQKEKDIFLAMKKSLLVQIHDALCIELYLSLPNKQENMEVYEEWKKWTENNKEEQTIDNLVHYILTPSNPLLNAIKNLQMMIRHLPNE